MQIDKSVFEQGCALFEVAPGSLQPLTGPRAMSHGEMHSAIYVGKGDGQSFVLKFSPISAEHITARRELGDFVAYLAENGAHVAKPLLSRDANRVEFIKIDDRVLVVTKTEKALGVHPDRYSPACNDAFFQAWGRTIGKVHALTQRYRGGAHFPTWREEHASFANMCQDGAVRVRWDEVGARFAALPESPDAFGIIHNDPHLENLLWDSDIVTLLDFDVSHRHWFMVDISIPLFCALTGAFRSPDMRNRDAGTFGRHFYEQFMVGYAQENHLDSWWLRQMPLFLKHRRILPFILYAERLIREDHERWQQWREAIVNDVSMTDPEYWAGA